MRGLRRRRLALVLVALTALLTLAGAASSSPGPVFKRYYLSLYVEGHGLAQSLGKTPLADGNGIDTSQGEVKSRFASRARLEVDIDPRSGRVKFPWPKPGYEWITFGSTDHSLPYACCDLMEGHWHGLVGDTPDAIGEYSCNFSAGSTQGGALPGAYVAWTFAGVPADGKIPVSFGIDQPQQEEPANPKVVCSGFPVDHGYPGEGTIETGVFMVRLTGKPHIARIPVKPLLATLTKSGRLVTVPGSGDIVDGQCGGCPLPMTTGDVATFNWTVDAYLRAIKP